jgi:hypothetical protein
MAPIVIKQKVLQEIDLLPEDKLIDIYNFIHHFRLGIETIRANSRQSTMAFAGCWADMPEDQFQAIQSDIEQRRHQAFARRRGDEGITP